MNIIKEKITNKKIFFTGLFILIVIAMYWLWPVQRNVVHNTYITDFNNIEKISGVSDNIFVAKILKNNGPRKQGRLLVTDYEAQVLYNIKGKAKGKITITQDGGYNKITKKLTLPKNIDLLEEGGVYLLSTSYGSTPEETVEFGLTSHKNTIIKINEQNIKNNKKVLEFKKAYINEILYNNKETKNSFKNLPEEIKNKLKEEIIETKNK